MTTKRDSSRPTFVGIGGMKCASTWLAECLRAHPDVFVTSPKEVHFFDDQVNRDRGEEWYLNHFRGSESYQAAGEIGAHYLGGALCIDNMRATLGPVQVLVSLRDPVERFLSEYKHRIRGGQLAKQRFLRLDRRNLHAAIEVCPTLRDWSLYAEPLERYFAAFGRENHFVILKDEIDSRPQQSLQRLYQFLDVDDSFVPPVADKAVSPGIVPRSMLLERTRIAIYGAVRTSAPWIIDATRRLRVGEWYRRLNANKAGGGIEVREEVRVELLEMFAGDVEKTASLLGCDLGNWLGNERMAA